MEINYYVRKNGPINPLTVAITPGTYSLETAATNLLRMQLMDNDEEMTAEQAFQEMMKIPFRERMKRINAFEWDLRGRDPDLRWLYDRCPYLDEEDELVPVEQVYRELMEEPDLTDEEINQNLMEMLNEYSLRVFWEECVGPAYWD